MAVNGIDIQVENGNFSRIHNAILERLAVTEFTGRELRCLLYLLRMTYGFQRKEYELSLNDWSAGTNISRPNIPETLRRLADRNIIYRTENGKRKPATFGFNKYFEQWNEPTATGKGFDSIPVDTTVSGIDVDTTNSIPVDTSDGIDVDTKSGIPLQTATTRIKDNRKKEQQRNGDIATVDTGEGGSSSFSPDDPPLDKKVAVVATAVEANGFGTLTPLMSEEITEMAKEYPLSWIGDAFRVAVRANKRKLSYVSGVLNNWKRDGYDPKAQIVQSNGQPVTVDIAM